ncbi:MAG: A24 family peptidase [Pseudomonadota bacterium]
MSGALSPLWARSLCLLAAVTGVIVSLSWLGEPDAWLGAGLAIWLSYASYIDIRSYLLLDVLTLPLVIFGLALAFLGQGPALLDATLGAALGYGALWALAIFYRKVRGREGLGLGDAKLLCAAGAWCGALALPFVLLISSLSALAVVGVAALGGRQLQAEFKIPFGPFLSFGFFITWTLQALKVLSGL